MDFMFNWEEDAERYSFEDSDRFEEDSLCSWISEPESLCNNWRGWRKQADKQSQGAPYISHNVSKQRGGLVMPLVELAAQAVAQHLPFEVVEHFHTPIPEQLQLRIAFWSFPDNEEDIRLYSCLANGSADEFQKGEHLYKAKAVRDALQIGFHLSATVVAPQSIAQSKGSFNVAVVFDRRKISSCLCTCMSNASWCSHVVALCLVRIHHPGSVCLRAPVSESLSRLHRDQLQKFAQYLISELPQQILPTAQRLLDELLSSQQTAINTVCGAPDPTAGPSASEQTTWCLDENTIHDNIKKTLIKFCVPTPIVFSDVNYLSSTAPPAAAEWQSLLRPLRGREPEGMWNLLSIVREMFRRNDSNSFPLLEILTEDVLEMDQVVSWWFATKIAALHSNPANHVQRGGQNNSSSSQHAASSLCDEVVALWRLAALNPALSPIQRDDLQARLRDWHIRTIDKVRKGKNSTVAGTTNSQVTKKNDIEMFPGFKPAIEACCMDWTNYPIPGLTYIEKRVPWRVWQLGRLHDAGDRKQLQRGQKPSRPELKVTLKATFSEDSTDGRRGAGTAGSSSSEGFCEADVPGSGVGPDSDSDLGDMAYGVSTGDTVEQPPHTPPAAAAASATSNNKTPSASPSNCNIENSGKCTRAVAGGAAVAMTHASSASSSSSTITALAQVSPSRPVNNTCTVSAASVPAAENADDQYQVYFYDSKAKVVDAILDYNGKKKKSDEVNYFAGLKEFCDKHEVLFARAEALHAHGHTREACHLAKQLAEDLLTNPPDLMQETTHAPVSKGKKKKAIQAQHNMMSSFASTILSRTAFLLTVLLEEADCHYLAFKVGMFGLEMPRPPAASKALEVKLAFQESELVTLLKKIPLGPNEFQVIRERAQSLRDGVLKSRGEALLPLTLASFVFDSLCLPAFAQVTGVKTAASIRGQSTRQPHDEELGFQAATAALGLKANISEAEHPLLCEGTRRQKGELAIAMLVMYKEDQTRLSLIMDRLLDKEVHQLYKTPSMSAFAAAGRMWDNRNATLASPPTTIPSSATSLAQASIKPVTSSQMLLMKSVSEGGAVADDTQSMTSTMTAAWQEVPAVPRADDETEETRHNLDYLNLEQRFPAISTVTSGVRPKKSPQMAGKDTDSSALEEEGDVGECKAWAARFRCAGLKTTKKHSSGMAAVDSSAPETTSSDNSPTLIRRRWHQGPGSDSGSSGKSSDSMGSGSPATARAAGVASAYQQRDVTASPTNPYSLRFAPHMVVDARAPQPAVTKNMRSRKSRHMPTIPNQPSEASAHFMFELAKSVLNKAGGSSSTSLFHQPSSNTNHGNVTHRALHLCAFQIGLYALGLHNCVSANWLSRTYSSHVSWITGQALEIGIPAINILIDTWEGHLTPPEVASLADRASRGREPNMVRAAAELALSCLPHAHALNPNEIQRALIQCKEQCQAMLERACLAVESAAKGGGVYPEVLFHVAKLWYELYEKSMSEGSREDLSVALPGAAEAAPVAPVAQLTQPMMQLVPVAPAQSSLPPTSQSLVIPSQQQPTVPVQPIVYINAGPPVGAQYMPHATYVQSATGFPASQANTTNSSSQIGPTGFLPPNYPAYNNQQALPFAPPPLYAQPLRQQTPPTYMNPPPASFYNRPQTSAMEMLPPPHPPPPPASNYSAVMVTQDSSKSGSGASYPAAAAAAGGFAAASNSFPQQPPSTAAAVQSNHNSTQMNYLLSVFRVGMLAMETLARRVHDDRPQMKFSRNPPYGEDVKWLLGIARKLGLQYLQQFCATAVNAVVSPFILQDIAVELATYLCRSNPAHAANSLRTPAVNPLMQKCLQMFIHCTHQRLQHISQAEYDEFVSIVCSARHAFCMNGPQGVAQFNDLLQSLRRSNRCKRDLWQRIVNGLATAPTL